MVKLFSIRALLPILLLSLGAAGFAALVVSKPQAQAIVPQEKTWVVAVEPVRIETLAPVVSLYGRVESPRAATLSAAVTAEVLEVPAQEGRPVTPGQTLVVLDDRELRLQVRQRQAEHVEIESELQSEAHQHRSDQLRLAHEQALLQLRQRSVERMQRLQETKVASEALLEEALLAAEQQGIAIEDRQLTIRDHKARLARLRARLERAAALRDMAELDLERTRIQAPFAGTVAQVMVAPGTRVRAGDPLLELYDTAALEVRAQIATVHQDTVYRALRAGQTLLANGRVDGEPVRFRLDRLAGRIASGSGGVDGLFQLTGDADRLKLGSFVQLWLQLPELAGVVALPYEALYGMDRVYTLVEGRMHPVRVERIGEWLGPEAETRVLVRAPDLREGDALILTQLPNAVDGLRVRAAAAS